jgi:multiple sugar transport system permease protein
MSDGPEATRGTATTERLWARAGGARVRTGSRLPTRSASRALLFLAPAIVLVGLFHYLPILTALYNSTQLFTVAGEPLGSAGADNYRTVLGDATFRTSLLLTLGFVAVKVPVQLALGLLAAVLVQRQTRFNRFVRSTVFLPTVTAMVVVSIIFTYLFDRELGAVNALLTGVGLGRADWLLEPQLAQVVMVALSLWRDVGLVMLVFLAGLQAIPSQLVDAARIDGATAWQEVRYIVTPLLARSFQFAVVFCTIAAVQFVAPIQIMTQGGPEGATRLASYHVYEEAFRFFDWGATSAMSMVLIAILLVVTQIELRVLRPRWEY